MALYIKRQYTGQSTNIVKIFVYASELENVAIFTY